MGGRDRTREFSDIVRSCLVGDTSRTQNCQQRTYATTSTYESGNETEPTLEANVESEFHMHTEQMGRRLNLMQKRIAEIEKLVKSRNIFEDHANEIETSTYEIRQWILEINMQLDSLENDASSHVTSRGPHLAAHYKSVIQSIRSRLADTTVQLKHLLELRAQSMKTQEERRRLYSHTSGCRNMLVSPDDLESGYMDSERTTFLDSEGKQTQTFAGKRLQPLYYSARAEAVQNIQAMIGELAQIFTRVASLVSAQEELSARIEDDMSSALHNLQQGEFELTKYMKNIVSNRSLIFKVFGILILFILFFVLVLT